MNKFLGAIALAMIVAQAAPVAASAHSGVNVLLHRSAPASHARSVKQKAYSCKDGCLA